VVIYWVTTNLFSLGQQFWVLRKYPPPKLTTTKSSSSSGGSGRSGSAAGRSGTATKNGSTSRNPFGLGSRAANTTGRGKDGKAAKAGPNGSKPNLTKGKSKADDSPPTAEGRSLAPRPGAKPVRKKGGPARRPSSG
jgi:YidC/Oxa1 family membrane protein insertase